jgi:hypothetical protein
MASFYDDASLVVIPSGYKTSKIYAEKPTDGSGDLTFTRASDATRVGPNGLIEKVRTNLILQSETFSNNTAWPKLNSATITANTSVAPDGTTTADTLTLTTNASSSIYQSITTVSELTFSVYAKVASGTKNFRLRFDRPSAIESADFTATTTWQRFTFTATTTGSGVVYILNDSTGTAGDLIIWGAQLETGDIATDYIPTTTAAVSVGPVSNVPRLDYLGSTCPRLNLEPQRTNYQLNSEDFDNWYAPNDGVTLSENTSDTLDPSGYNGAAKVTTTGGNKRIYDIVSIPAGSSTYSVFVKAGTGNLVQLFSSNVAFSVVFNLSTQSVTATIGSGTITSYGNGWYRCTATGTTPSGDVIQILFPNSVGQTTYIWGAQWEAGAYATSYIPTLGASVTRVADGAGTSDVFGTTFTLNADFGLYWEGVINGNNVYPVFFSGGNYASGADFRSYMTYTGTDLQLFGVGEAGTAGRTISLTAGTYYKILVKRVGSTIKWYVNGTEYANQSGTTTTTVKIRSLFGSTLGLPNHESVAQALIFQTTLSDAQGIELTA